ncbi:MAG: hypothetical protein HC812_16660 [Leptolyngbya sp. RL_3_1]|nr:hypothetical protein [Leptolyngbya sp. RL_3_1]
MSNSRSSRRGAAQGRPSFPPGLGQQARSTPPLKRDQRPRPSSNPRSPARGAPPVGYPPPSRAVSEIASLQAQLQTPAPLPQRSRLNRLAGNWKAWSVITVVLLSGLAGVSVLSLFRIPNLPNCRAIFWPTASAATRLQCAEAYADQGNVDSLLAAIELVDSLPADHPMRAEVNERIEGWAEQILNIAERRFQDGDLDAAVAAARRIPASTAAAAMVAERIQTWEAIWQEATEIF